MFSFQWQLDMENLFMHGGSSCKNQKPGRGHLFASFQMIVHKRIQELSLFGKSQNRDGERKRAAGSITVEASLAFPIFLLGMLALLFLFPLMKNQEELQVSVLETGKWASQMEYFCNRLDLEENWMETLLLQEHIKHQVSEEGFWENCSFGGKNGLVGLDCVMGEEIHLGIRHAVVMPIKVPGFSLRFGLQTADTRGFLGDAVFPSNGEENGETGEEEEKYVYITDWGEVYHLSPDCKTLNPTIYEAPLSEMESKRNGSGGKYYPCESCGGGTGIVYYTPEGTRYHSRKTCSALKRTVHAVLLSEVAGMRACKVCGD